MKNLPVLALAVSFFATEVSAEINVTSRATVFSGPYDVEIIRVIDGDTVEVRVAIWPGLVAEYSIRIRGIDSPEIRRPGCEEELEWALEAKRQAERLLNRLSVQVANVSYTPSPSEAEF